MYTYRIEVYTRSLVISGSYDLLLYRRISDAVNSEQRRYLPLRDAAIAPLGRENQAQRVPHLQLDRRESLLIIPLVEAQPPEGYRLAEEVRETVPISVMLFTDTVVVWATFHKRPDLTFTEVLERSTDDFLPLSNIQAFPLSSGFPSFKRDFALLARERIAAFYQVLEEPGNTRAASSPGSDSTELSGLSVE